MTKPKPTLSAKNRKLGELILYLAERGRSDPYFGATKLDKVLLFADFLSYARRRMSITSQVYVKEKWGPIPTQLVKVKKALADAGLIQEKKASAIGGKHQRHTIIPKRKADMTEFSDEEIAIVDEVFDKLRSYNASEASALSYRRLPAGDFEIGETFPYSAAFVSAHELTEEEKAYALQLTPVR